MVRSIVMFASFAVFLIFLGNSTTGFFAWRLLSSKSRRSLDVVETVITAFALGTVINGWIAVVAAELGLFKPLILFGGWLLLNGGLLIWAMQRSRLTLPAVRRSGRDTLLLLLWLPLACFLFFRPHHFVQGAADAGVYVNIAANLAQTGRLQIFNESLATLDPALYDTLLRQAPPNEIEPYLYKLGFYIEQVGTGDITPQFYPQHPAWLAVAHLLGGVYGSLLLTGLWSIGGVLAAYLIARDLHMRYAAWLVLGALTLNAMQVWFARYPTTEMLTQFLIGVGLWASARFLRDNDPLMAALAGLTLGAAHLTRIDAVFLLIVPILLFVWLVVRGTAARWRVSLFFFGPYSVLLVHSLAHAYWRSRPYFFSIFGFQLAGLLNRPILLLMLAASGVVALLILLTQATRLASLWATYRGWLQTAAAAVVIALTLYGWFVRPVLGDTLSYTTVLGGGTITLYDHQNMLRLAWYLSPFGIWLGLLGAGWQVRRLDRQRLLLLTVGLLFTFVYLWQIRATPSQIYSMRRYVPITLPFLIIMASLLLDWMIAQKRLLWRVLGGALTACWLAGFVWLARGFVTQVDQVGQIEQMAAISAQLAPHSIVIFNDVLINEGIGHGEFIGLPLQFLHQHSIYSLRQSAELDSQRFQAQLQRWAEDGYAIYWADVDAAETQVWPLDAVTLGAPQPYEVIFSVLEGPFDRRPAKLDQVRWSGRFQRVLLGE